MGKLLVAIPPGAPPAAVAPSQAAPAGPFAIRELRAEDWRELMAWEMVFLRDTPLLLKTPAEIVPQERFAKEIGDAVGNERRHLLAATFGEDGAERIVGYASVSVEPFSRMAHMGFVFLGVLPAYRRRGIGRALAAGLDAWARERKLSRLTGFAQAANDAARRFAAAAGYEEEVRQRGYAIIDGVPSDRIRFGKAVASPHPNPPPQGGRGNFD